MTNNTAELSGSPTWEGAAITNVHGVPGTVACLARTRHEQRLVLVTTQHALFGGGADRRSPVSLLARDSNAGVLQQVGSAGWGRRGTVRYAGADVFVDCAVVELGMGSSGWRVRADDVAEARSPTVGMRVQKTGAATGTTEGVIVELDHTAWARDGAREYPAPGQLLISSLPGGRLFSSSGDSGALVRDEEGAPLGLLWGLSGSCSVVCPIAPVWWVLHVQPVRLWSGVPLTLSTRNS